MSIRFPVRWTPGLGELKTKAFKDLFRFLVIQLAPDTTLLEPVAILGVKSEPIELVVQLAGGAKAGIVEVSVIGRWTGGMDPFRGVPLVTAMLDQFRRLVQNSDDRPTGPTGAGRLGGRGVPGGRRSPGRPADRRAVSRRVGYRIRWRCSRAGWVVRTGSSASLEVAGAGRTTRCWLTGWYERRPDRFRGGRSPGGGSSTSATVGHLGFVAPSARL